VLESRLVVVKGHTRARLKEPLKVCQKEFLLEEMMLWGAMLKEMEKVLLWVLTTDGMCLVGPMLHQ
jgi:hypothetical protein